MVIRLELNNYICSGPPVFKSKSLLHKKWNFPLKISSVNVTKSAVWLDSYIDSITNNYYIVISMKTINSIPRFILKIQPIPEFHDLSGNNFWPLPPKNHWSNFELYWICNIMQKTSWFHQILIEIKPTLESCDQSGHTLFWVLPTKS